MTNESTGPISTVTKVTVNREAAESPLMSYTAVTTHQAMAEAFLKEITRLAQKIMPEHPLTIEDLLSICHLALDRRERGVVMLEGRHLRGRISEQISRAARYNETFSLLVLKVDGHEDTTVYDSVVDTLCERMRQTDLMFLFKQRVVLLLPHTPREAMETLSRRIEVLLNKSVVIEPPLRMSALTYPSPELHKSSDVLDWAEDQLRE